MMMCSLLFLEGSYQEGPHDTTMGLLIALHLSLKNPDLLIGAEKCAATGNDTQDDRCEASAYLTEYANYLTCKRTCSGPRHGSREECVNYVTFIVTLITLRGKTVFWTEPK